MPNTSSNDNLIGAIFGGGGALLMFAGWALVKFHNEFHFHYHSGSPTEVRNADPSPAQQRPPRPIVRQAPPAPAGLAGGTGLKQPRGVVERNAPPTGHEVRSVPPAADPVEPPKRAALANLAEPATTRDVEPAHYFVDMLPERIPKAPSYPNHGHGYKEIRDRHPDGSVTWNYVCPDCGKVLVTSATRLPLATDRRSVKLARKD